jgi:hypothetical protein
MMEKEEVGAILPGDPAIKAFFIVRILAVQIE